VQCCGDARFRTETRQTKVHPRGEHSATSIDIGVQLVEPNQRVVSGSIVIERENIDTHRFVLLRNTAATKAARYESTTIQSGTIKPKEGLVVAAMELLDGFASTSGQAGAPVGVADADGNNKKSVEFILYLPARHAPIA